MKIHVTKNVEIVPANFHFRYSVNSHQFDFKDDRFSNYCF